MASIRSSIELQDNFTSILMNVINAVNLSVSTMEQMQSVMNEPIDTAAIQRMRDQLNQATIAARELDAAMQGMETSTPAVPESPALVNIPIHPIAPEPLPVLVQWQSYEGVEVFTNSGIDRFQAEVQSTNNMLDVLNQTQAEIAARTAQANIFPPNMAADMNGMQNRLQAIQTRIQAIESNPLNMGTDAANAELEQLRTQLNQAVQEQESMNRAVENMDIQAANEAYLRLSQIISGTERHIRDNVDEQGRFNQAIEQGTDQANELMEAIKGAVAAYATVQTVGQVIHLSDTMTQTQARLSMLVDVDDGGSVAELQDMIYLSAERSRGSYQATADAVSKMGLMAGDAFANNEEIIAFMEQINKQFVIAGTEASGIDAAMLQLTQAMGSGVLRGEEYNSVLEQAPNIIQSISDYMGVSIGELRDMAAEGKITADIVKSAMFEAADETNAKFESMPMTFGQMWTSFQNTALIAFQPVLERMNEIANSDSFQSFVDNAIAGLSIVSGAALEIFDLLAAGAGIISDNWSWLSPVILGVAGALIFYYGAMLLYNAVTGASTAITSAKAFAETVHAASLAMSTGATFTYTAAQYGLNAAMYACPITWIIILIIALVAALYAGVVAMNKFAGTSISATGIIMGAFFIMGAFIYNSVLVPMQQAFARHANFIGNVFNNPIAAVKVAFYDMCLTVIGYIQSLASGIETLLNAIPGVTVDITSGLDRFYSGLEAAQQSVKDESGWIEYVEEWDYMDYTDAANAGYRFGQGIESSIAGFDPASLFENNIPNPEGYMDLSNYAGSGIGDLGGIGSGVDDIAGNTAAMADAMEITGEELKYLRDIAEQEAVNRFTTAEIKIEQTNYNTIRGEMDLDGIVTGLDEAMGEAIEISMEGVHA